MLRLILWYLGFCVVNAFFFMHVLQEGKRHSRKLWLALVFGSFLSLPALVAVIIVGLPLPGVKPGNLSECVFTLTSPKGRKANG